MRGQVRAHGTTLYHQRRRLTGPGVRRRPHVWLSRDEFTASVCLPAVIGQVAASIWLDFAVWSLNCDGAADWQERAAGSYSYGETGGWNHRMKKLLWILFFCVAAHAQGTASANDRTWLDTTIGSGTFADLRWPNFSDYSQHLQKFYSFGNDSLWWVTGTEPTPQARQAIALLQQAGQKGLSADDYDGPRWNDRLASLKAAGGQPASQAAVKFDLALTISVMRYISDLHIGKVNPKRLAFQLDDQSKKYDLPEFLRDNVVGASDVAGSPRTMRASPPGSGEILRSKSKFLGPT